MLVPPFPSYSDDAKGEHSITKKRFFSQEIKIQIFSNPEQEVREYRVREG